MNFIEKDEVIRLELGLTSTCNLECPLCIRQTHPEFINNSKVKYRSKEEIISQIGTYENLEFVTIAGAVSEPTLHPELFDIIKYLITRDIDISLFINGDTHDELYYKKLGAIFRAAKGNIYFTICGSTQEIHSKYRVNSNLETVMKHLEITEKFSNKCILTWIVFNYNEEDFNENYHLVTKYRTEFFNTLPVQEHFDLDTDIHLIDSLQKVYSEQIDKDDFKDITCPANNYKFQIMDFEGNTNPCALYKMFGEKHCFECSEKNAKILRENKIYHLAEPEDEYSEVALRYDYD